MPFQWEFHILWQNAHFLLDIFKNSLFQQVTQFKSNQGPGKTALDTEIFLEEVKILYDSINISNILVDNIGHYEIFLEEVKVLYDRINISNVLVDNIGHYEIFLEEVKILYDRRNMSNVLVDNKRQERDGLFGDRLALKSVQSIFKFITG